MTDRDIIDRYPDLFDLSGDVTTTQMMYGFQGVAPGWLAIMDRLCAQLQAVDKPKFRFNSVKEKLGCLRIAFRDGSDAIGETVNAAKAEAMVTCDQCGAPGALREMDGLWAARCEQCKMG
jgi:hypothetical protein